MKSIPIVVVLFLHIACTNEDRSEILENENQYFESIYPFALRGEMKIVFNILDTINENKLTPKELELKERYYNRFINKNDEYEYKVNDSTITNFVDIFHSYWCSILINNEQIKIADSLFIESMSNYILTHSPALENISPIVVKNDLYNYGNEFLNEKGYFSNAFGKTGQLYDLFLWKKEEVKNYSIELVNKTVTVKVHLMDDFISTGWSHYTTFGRKFASGWANREALFCVASAYDLESENYKISYLTHEGQHFSDYNHFPQLQQRDLEYRAKLIELIKSNKTTLELIRKFKSKCI